MKNLNDYRIFIETARLGSISACARQMDITPATASASIKRLEAELDAALFVRSTRSLRLSPAGEKFLPLCREALSLFDEAAMTVKGDGHTLSGQIRLSSPSDFGRNILLPWLDDFMELHPNIKVQLHLSDSYADLYGQQIDLALRYGMPKDSGLIAMPIVPNSEVVLCASPTYLKKYGVPQHPQELTKHNCLCLAHQDRYNTSWQFNRLQDGKLISLKVDVSGNRMSKDGDAVRRWAVAGKGIARKSYLDIAKDVKNGSLTIIKFAGSGWQQESYPLYLLCAERRLLNPTIRALKEHLLTCVQTLKCDTK